MDGNVESKRETLLPIHQRLWLSYKARWIRGTANSGTCYLSPRMEYLVTSFLPADLILISPSRLCSPILIHTCNIFPSFLTSPVLAFWKMGDTSAKQLLQAIVTAKWPCLTYSEPKSTQLTCYYSGWESDSTWSLLSTWRATAWGEREGKDTQTHTVVQERSIFNIWLTPKFAPEEELSNVNSEVYRWTSNNLVSIN